VNNKLKKKHKLMIILFIPLLIVLGLGIAYSMFHSDATLVSEDQGLAKFIFDSESTSHINLSMIGMKPGDKEDYLFSVTNNKSASVSQVTIEYQLTIRTYHIMPFSIILYKEDGETEEFVMECDENYSRNDDNELVCNSPVQIMRHSTSTLDNYRLEVEFPSEYDDPSYSGLIDYINVEIKSWQKIGS